MICDLSATAVPLDRSYWNAKTEPHICIAFVPVEQARAWHRGELTDDDLFLNPLSPAKSHGAALFIKKLYGPPAWRALGAMLAGLRPPLLALPAFHPSIRKRLEKFHATPGFVCDTIPRVTRYLGDGESLTRFIDHCPGL